jgi:hypothetical protein
MVMLVGLLVSTILLFHQSLINALLLLSFLPGLMSPVTKSSLSTDPSGMYSNLLSFLEHNKLCKAQQTVTIVDAFSGDNSILDIKILHLFANMPKAFSETRLALDNLK